MMKAETDPRRVYNRNGVTHVCFKGTYFAPAKKTRIDLEGEVKIEAMPKSGGRLRIQVKQRKGKANVVETWREATVPVEHRH